MVTTFRLSEIVNPMLSLRFVSLSLLRNYMIPFRFTLGFIANVRGFTGRGMWVKANEKEKSKTAGIAPPADTLGNCNGKGIDQIGMKTGRELHGGFKI